MNDTTEIDTTTVESLDLSIESSVSSIVENVSEEELESVLNVSAVLDHNPVVPDMTEVIVEESAVVELETTEAVAVDSIMNEIGISNSNSACKDLDNTEAKMACNPVKYSDLGKDAKDLINKSFDFGVVKLEGKTKSKSGMGFTAKGTHDPDAGSIDGGLDLKWKAGSFDVTNKWNTTNEIDTNIDLGEVAKGISAEIDTSIAPDSGKMGLQISSAFAHEFIHSTHDVDVTGKTLSGSVVAGYNGMLIGAKGSFDANTSTASCDSVSLAYHCEGVKIHSSMCEFTKFSGSVFHKVSDKIAATAAVAWSDSSSPSLTVAGQYAIDNDSSLKVKVDNAFGVGLSYLTKLRDGVQVTFSALVNAKDINAGGHKVGMSLNFEA